MICQECSYLAPTGAETCPNCGAALLETINSADVEPIQAVVAEPGRSSRPWLIGAAVGVAVLVVGGLSFALTKDQSSDAAFSDRMPADVISYVEVDIGQLLSDDSKGVIEDFGGVIESVTGEEFDIDTIVQDTIDEFDSQMGTDFSYDEDLASWATGSIAMGLLQSDDLVSQSFVVWVSGQDENALAGFLNKIETLASAEGMTLGRTTVAGVDFLTAPEVFGQSTGLVGQVGQDLLIVSDEQLAAEVLGLTPEDSLQAVSGFADRIALVPDNAIVTFASDGEMTADLLGTAAFGVAPLSFEDTSLGWIVGSFAVDEGNIRFDSVTGLDPESGLALPEESPAFDALPAESILFARMYGLTDRLASLRYAMGPDVDDEVEAITGVTLDDILGLFEVDAALGVWPSSEPEIPVGAAFVGVGGADASSVVDRLNQTLVNGGGLNATTIPGGYWYDNLVAFGSRGPLTLVTTDRALLANPPAQSLASGAAYGRTVELIGSGFQPVFGADVDGVVDLVDGFIDDPEVLDALACNPVRFIATGYSADGDLARVIAVIEIFKPDGC